MCVFQIEIMVQKVSFKYNYNSYELYFINRSYWNELETQQVNNA